VLSQLGNNLGNRRTLLADSNINTDNIATLLVDDGIDGNSGLAGLTVPMISSRWPRPIGTMESIAFRPVAIG
jgi:hypothetical protein